MKFGKWLIEAGVSQRGFAKLLGARLNRRIGQPAVSRWAHGLSRPKLEAIMAIKQLTAGQVAETDWLPPTRRRSP